MKIILILLMSISLYATPIKENKIRIFDEVAIKNKKGWVIGDAYTLCINNHKYLLITTPRGATVIQMYNYTRTNTGLVQVPINCK